MHYLFIPAQKVRLAIKGMLKNIPKTTKKEKKGKDQIRFTHFKKLKGSVGISKAVNGIACVVGVSARVIARKLGSRKKMVLQSTLS